MSTKFSCLNLLNAQRCQTKVFAYMSHYGNLCWGLTFQEICLFANLLAVTPMSIQYTCKRMYFVAYQFNFSSARGSMCC